MLKRFKITQRKNLDKSIQIPITLKYDTFGLEDTLETFVENEVKKQITSENLKEKVTFKNNDTRTLKFFFLKNNNMNAVFDNANLSKSDLDNFYKSQFIIELFDSNIPSSQKRIDQFYITLYQTITLNRSEFNLNNFLNYIQIPEKHINTNLFLRFSFFNAKDNKRYVFKLGNTEEINNNNQFLNLLLDNNTKTYRINTPNLELYQAVVLNKKGIPEENENNDLLPNNEDNNKEIETTPQQSNAILNDSGLFTILTDDKFSCYLSNENFPDDDAGTSENPLDIFKDFFNPRYPMITIKAVNFSRDNLSLNGSVYNPYLCTIPVLGENGGIGQVGRGYIDLYGNPYLYYEIQISYYISYTINGNYFPRPDDGLDAVQATQTFYNVLHDALFCDFETTKAAKVLGYSLIGYRLVLFNYDEGSSKPYEGIIQPNETLNILLSARPLTPSDRDPRRTGFLDFSFFTELPNVNIMYLDKDNKIITTNYYDQNTTSYFSSGNEFYVNPDNGVIQQGVSYEPVDYLRIKLI